MVHTVIWILIKAFRETVKGVHDPPPTKKSPHYANHIVEMQESKEEEVWIKELSKEMIQVIAKIFYFEYSSFVCGFSLNFSVTL